MLIFTAAGVDREVRQRPADAGAVRVAAVDGDLSIGTRGRDFQEQISDRLASEMGRPFIVGELPLVPAGLPERRNMRGDQDAAEGLQRLDERGRNSSAARSPSALRTGQRSAFVMSASSAISL